jgi:hypothetical protein
MDLLRLRNAQISTNFTGEKVVDFRVSRYAGSRFGLRIKVNRVASTLSKQLATMVKQVPDEIAAFHSAV